MTDKDEGTLTRSEPAKGGRQQRLTLIAGVAAAATIVALATALLVNIIEKKQEARNPFFRVVELDDTTADPVVWGKNFPHQYDGYRRTTDQQRTRYGGSEAVPRTPTQADPRSIVAQSRLEEDPRLRTFWAGYAFSKDFREERGHAYMLLDQRLTERQQAAKQPGACLHCHTSAYGIYKQLGNGDLIAGFHAVNRMPYSQATAYARHPVACIDCHDPKTLALRVTRPAFMLAIKKVKAESAGPDYDVNRDATRQEMRAYVCGQCHVEYYFKGKEKTLTYPWDNGLRADQIYAYYEAEGFKDWTHAEAGSPTLKAQHPEFEMWSQGTHARAGVACADCHMPYQRVGAVKVSDHHVRSPLLNVSNACQGCHHASEQELLGRAHIIQEKTHGVRDLAMNAVVALIGELKRAKQAGRPDAELAGAQKLHRKAQFFLDFVEAENSTGFHADQEAMRILALSLDAARLGQLALRDPAYAAEATAVAADAGATAADAGATVSDGGALAH
ncbi:MAG TPA: ammonia-forming cytochrome c nitrite reductase subunit c552 [Polyangiaceae bacterium]|nr:ammonia-forming cytochrome c nitrite reductase subunit c552 [Polyangiaceae bacterium]